MNDGSQGDLSFAVTVEKSLERAEVKRQKIPAKTYVDSLEGSQIRLDLRQGATIFLRWLAAGADLDVALA